jgi:hypothetical protein
VFGSVARPEQFVQAILHESLALSGRSMAAVRFGPLAKRLHQISQLLLVHRFLRPPR